MFEILKILEEEYIFDYLVKRNLLTQYKKSKKNVLSGNYTGNKIGYRQPKENGIIYFRINKQFRALARFLDKNTLVVFDIDNHQK